MRSGRSATAGAVEESAAPVYLEVATVNGVPAYIGAFRTTGPRLDFTMAAVSQDGCTVLYLASSPAA